MKLELRGPPASQGMGCCNHQSQKQSFIKKAARFLVKTCLVSTSDIMEFQWISIGIPQLASSLCWDVPWCAPFLDNTPCFWPWRQQLAPFFKNQVNNKKHQSKSNIWGKYGYGSIPINTIFRGMNIHLPAILMFTRGTRFWHTAT